MLSRKKAGKISLMKAYGTTALKLLVNNYTTIVLALTNYQITKGVSSKSTGELW